MAVVWVAGAGPPLTTSHVIVVVLPSNGFRGTGRGPFVASDTSPNSYAPMSQFPPVGWGRVTPRWSVVTATGVGAVWSVQAATGIALIAGLPAGKARVIVGPPLFASGPRPRVAAARTLSVGCVNAQLSGESSRLWPSEVSVAAVVAQSAPVGAEFSATIEFFVDTFSASL